MGIKINLDKVEAWEPSGQLLGPGEHLTEVVHQEEKNDGDHPEVELKVAAVTGEEEGFEITDWIHITQKSLGRVRQVIEAHGVEVPEGEFEFPNLVGLKAKTIVRREPKYNDPSKTVTKVKGYVALSPEENVQATLDATPTESGATKPDDDIPF